MIVTGSEQVLVRVSGKTDVQSSGLIRDALLAPETFYNQYSYESTDGTMLVDAQQGVHQQTPRAKILRLHFEPGTVTRLLRQAKLPVWGNNRPGLLLWLAVSEAGERRLLTPDDAHEAVASLVDQAKLRGLPLLFPLLDLEDASQVSTAEVWGTFLDRVDAASSRYNPGAVLTGRLQQDSTGQWVGSWSFRIVDRWQSAGASAFSADELVRGMLDQLADELSTRYALDSSQGEITLTVEGVTDLRGYTELTRYLEALTPVRYSSVIALREDRVEFELQTEGQYEQLVEIMALEERLMLLQQEPETGRLLYRWAH